MEESDQASVNNATTNMVATDDYDDNANKIHQQRAHRDSDASDGSFGHLMVSSLYNNSSERKNSISFDKIKQISLTYSLQSEDDALVVVGETTTSANNLNDDTDDTIGEGQRQPVRVADEQAESSGSWCCSPDVSRKVSVIDVGAQNGQQNQLEHKRTLVATNSNSGAASNGHLASGQSRASLGAPPEVADRGQTRAGQQRAASELSRFPDTNPFAFDGPDYEYADVGSARQPDKLDEPDHGRSSQDPLAQPSGRRQRGQAQYASNLSSLSVAARRQHHEPRRQVGEGSNSTISLVLSNSTSANIIINDDDDDDEVGAEDGDGDGDGDADADADADYDYDDDDDDEPDGAELGASLWPGASDEQLYPEQDLDWLDEPDDKRDCCSDDWFACTEPGAIRGPRVGAGARGERRHAGGQRPAKDEPAGTPAAARSNNIGPGGCNCFEPETARRAGKLRIGAPAGRRQTAPTMSGGQDFAAYQRLRDSNARIGPLEPVAAASRRADQIRQQQMPIVKDCARVAPPVAPCPDAGLQLASGGRWRDLAEWPDAGERWPASRLANHGAGRQLGPATGLGPNFEKLLAADELSRRWARGQQRARRTQTRPPADPVDNRRRFNCGQPGGRGPRAPNWCAQRQQEPDDNWACESSALIGTQSRVHSLGR